MTLEFGHFGLRQVGGGESIGGRVLEKADDRSRRSVEGCLLRVGFRAEINPADIL